MVCLLPAVAKEDGQEAVDIWLLTPMARASEGVLESAVGGSHNVWGLLGEDIIMVEAARQLQLVFPKQVSNIKSIVFQ